MSHKVLIGFREAVVFLQKGSTSFTPKSVLGRLLHPVFLGGKGIYRFGNLPNVENALGLGPAGGA